MTASEIASVAIPNGSLPRPRTNAKACCMVKAPAAKPDTDPSAIAGVAVLPPLTLHITLTSWPAGGVLHRGQWAVAIHAAFAKVQGLCWMSRQDDSAQAVVLFGDRIPDGGLTPSASTRSLVGDPAAYGELLVLAEQIGVDIVPGRR